MIRTLFVINEDGAVIIEKHYRGATSRAVCDYFWEEVCKCERREDMLPIISTPKYYLISIYVNKLFIVASVTREVNALLAIELLHRINNVFKHYFTKVSEGTIKQNFSTVYQILEEMLDNGFPLITEPNMLTSMVAPPSVLSRMKNALGRSSVAQDLPQGTLSQVPWRKAGVRYNQNQIFFDIFEDIDCIIDNKGRIISCDVNGTIDCNCHLSGIPDLTLSFTNPAAIGDCSFHPCVRYSRYEREKVVSFVPPDGSFQLMKYRVLKPRPSGVVEPPIYCKPSLVYDKSGTSARLHIMVKAKPSASILTSKPGKEPFCDEIEVHVPFSKHTQSTDLTASDGTSTFDEVTKVLVWKLPRLKESMSPTLSGRILLPSNTDAAGESLTVLLHFKMQDSTISGLRVDNLNLTNEKYRPYKGVRCMTRTGKYQIRA